MTTSLRGNRKNEIAKAEAIFKTFEELWRKQYCETGPIVSVEEGESVSDRLEIAQFSFGLMASIMRTGRALTILAGSGYNVESSAMFRSLIDQAMALESLVVHGVHAVHAYGLENKFNLEKILEASQEGFPLSENDREYIKRFIDLADAQEKTKELNQAINGIKTSTIGKDMGAWEKYLYQMWLMATSLSKPSMKLADMYSHAEPIENNIRILTFMDSSSEATIDPRLPLQFIVPNALLAYVLVLKDECMADSIRTLVLELGLTIDLRMGA